MVLEFWVPLYVSRRGSPFHERVVKGIKQAILAKFSVIFALCCCFFLSFLFSLYLANVKGDEGGAILFCKHLSHDSNLRISFLDCKLKENQ